MSVVKRKGRFEVYVYDPAVKRKRYFGRYDTEKEANKVFRNRTDELQGDTPELAPSMTVREYVDYWLENHHGEHTARPARTTYTLNETALRPFLQTFGDRAIRGGIKRGEAVLWAKKHRHNAKTVAAMFTDAFNDEQTDANPFRDLRLQQLRGRKDIHPITEPELDALAETAEKVWGKYGKVVRGWILFAAWTGMRPGEVFSARWTDLDFKDGTLTVTRIKGRKQTERIIFPSAAQEAVLDMPVERSGLLFTTTTGKPLDKGSSRYYFDRVRTPWLLTLSEQRRQEILGGRPSFDVYALRHFCASVMVRQGLNEFDVAHQLGNTPEVARETYIHPYRDETNERIRTALEGGRVADLDAVRRRRGIA